MKNTYWQVFFLDILTGKAECVAKHNKIADFSNEMSKLTVKNNLTSFKCSFEKL